ncbi:MAG: histidine kinase dimerization/phospho-acceptor domain-containing protein [Candidatus Sulfotelmatobacter sp.]
MASRTVFLRTYSKFWAAAVAACMVALVLGALILPRSFALLDLSDWIQCVLLLSGTLALIPNTIRSRGRLRLFWALLATGMAFWFSYQVMWTYFEVWLRVDVPDLFAGDIVLFLHIVPMMAALALRPHAAQEEYSARLRRLDFALMMVWWMYLYVFAVMAWQYIVPNVAAYNGNLNLLYLIEKLAFLCALSVAWTNSKGGWKTLYANLFGASLTYAASSYFANWALGHQAYYSGSLYDIPLTASMAWITIIGLWSRYDAPQSSTRTNSASQGVWLARIGMITVFSLPIFAGWALLDAAVPPRIRAFRLVLTLGAAAFMGIVVFVRQRSLDRELLRLLNQSRESFANLKRLQAQITESEKLASIGQLVGGAAHELNNPIAAMMGYSDLLLTTPLDPHQHELAARIGQHVRRTKSLVASLLSFAKQGPAAMTPVDINTLLRTAIKLSQPQWKTLNIEVRTDLQPNLPRVLGDSNQLLQVCVQILNTAINSVDQQNSRTLTVVAEYKDGLAVVHIFDGAQPVTSTENPALSAEQDAPDPARDLTLAGLGLTACQGILQQHRGKIFWHKVENCGTSIRIELPVMAPPSEKSLAAAAPAKLTQPFA